VKSNIISNQKHILISVALFLLIKAFMPQIYGLTAHGVNAIGLFIAVVYLWTTVSIGWPSYLIIGLVPFLSFMSPNEVFRESFGSWLVPFVISMIILNNALKECGFTKRIALWFITREIVRNRPWVLITMFLLSSMFVGMFMSNVPTMVIFLAMAEALLNDLGYQRGEKLPAVLMTGLNVSISMAYGATPIAHSVPLMVLAFIQRDFGVLVSFGKYMIVGVPLSLVFFFIMILVLKYIYKPDVTKLKNYKLDEKKKELKPMTMQEQIISSAFLILIFIFLFPTFGHGFAPNICAFLNKIGTVPPTIVIICILCNIKIDNRPLIEINNAFRDVNWSSVILIAAISLVGTMLTHESTGVTPFLTGVFQPLAISASSSVFVLVIIFWTLLQTNIMSNTVAATVVYSVAIPLLTAHFANILNPAALGIMISIAACYAFLTPTATPCCSISAGSGWITVKEMVQYGALLFAISLALLYFVGYPLLAFVL